MFTPNGHIRMPERILGHVVRVEFIDLAHDDVHVWLMRLSEKEEFDAGNGLEASHAEQGRL